MRGEVRPGRREGVGRRRRKRRAGRGRAGWLVARARAERTSAASGGSSSPVCILLASIGPMVSRARFMLEVRTLTHAP